MLMDFLRRIQEASLPLIVVEEAEIQCAADLVAVKFIEASLRSPR